MRTADGEPASLERLVEEFAAEWDTLLKGVFPHAPDFEVETRGTKVVVRPEGRVVPLYVNDMRLASLEVSANCCWDSESRYLAVEASRFNLAADLDRRTPILRFEYVREMNRAPHSHIQVHAQSGTMSHLLSRTGHPTPHMFTSLHLPTGGSRFRPCLEDVVQFLIEECHFQYIPGYREYLDEGRARWRRRQVAAAVRAVPSEAVRQLEDMGYTVIRADDVPADSRDALIRW